jgi:plastocyanin
MWVNGDDVPHLIASADGRFRSSPALDTDQQFTLKLDRRGTYPYFCSLHPKMTGRIVVE